MHKPPEAGLQVSDSFFAGNLQHALKISGGGGEGGRRHMGERQIMPEVICSHPLGFPHDLVIGPQEKVFSLALSSVDGQDGVSVCE